MSGFGGAFTKVWLAFVMQPLRARFSTREGGREGGRREGGGDGSDQFLGLG